MSKSPRTTHERMIGVRPQTRERWCLDVRGHVQGVGFRPFVQRLATRFALAGSVHNAGAAVRIEAEGTPASLTAFVDALSRETPTRALRITQATLPPRGDAGFTIRASDGADMRDLPPDVATCADCLRDLRDATTCMNCSRGCIGTWLYCTVTTTTSTT
jgi:hydrogenase maturation protein HypF